MEQEPTLVISPALLQTNDAPWNEVQVRDGIQRQIALHMDGLQITASDMRELMICLMERVLKTREFPAAVMLQAGHSIETAILSYGFSNLDHQSIDRFSMNAYLMASRDWQKAIGLEGLPIEGLPLEDRVSVKGMVLCVQVGLVTLC
jgi:hypothetical protein